MTSEYITPRRTNYLATVSFGKIITNGSYNFKVAISTPNFTFLEQEHLTIRALLAPRPSGDMFFNNQPEGPSSAGTLQELEESNR